MIEWNTDVGGGLGLFHHWRPTARLITFVALAIDKARVVRPHIRTDRPSVGKMTAEWLLNYEIASGKHPDGP